MENYNDELMPESFEQIAKAYSKNLKNKGFVFIRLEEEEFNLLLGEIFVIIGKMKACLKKLRRQINSRGLEEKLDAAAQILENKFGKKQTHCFEYIENENNAFLCLVALENTLNIKLMLLSIKSGELEICNQITTAVSGVFAESFSIDGFKVI